MFRILLNNKVIYLTFNKRRFWTGLSAMLLLWGNAFGSDHMPEILYQETGNYEWKIRGRPSSHWVYKGEVLNGKPHGEGVATHPLGATYSGSWQDGFYHGEGIFRGINGATFKGSYRKGKKHGRVEYDDPGGVQFSGIFHDDRRHGKGTQHFPDGSSLTGIWKNGRLVEELELRNPALYFNPETKKWSKNGVPNRDGFYEGEVKNSLPDGRGTYRSHDGVIYDGIWKAGIREGLGKITWSDGSNYRGQFHDGKRQGRGKQTYSEGHVYIGDFKEGIRHGTGSFTYGSGPNKGDHFVGEYHEGRRHGHGSYFFADGRKYIGRFDNGTQSGQGRFFWKNGLEFKGGFRKGKPWEGVIIDRFCEVLELKGFDCMHGSIEAGVYRKHDLEVIKKKLK